MFSSCVFRAYFVRARTRTCAYAYARSCVSCAYKIRTKYARNTHDTHEIRTIVRIVRVQNTHKIRTIRTKYARIVRIVRVRNTHDTHDPYAHVRACVRI